MELESKAETVYNNLNRDRSLRLLLLNIAIDISCYLIQGFFFFGKRDLMMSAVGRIYGRWTVIAEAPTMGSHEYWLCQCQCGTRRTVRGSYLRGGQSKSCGCYRNEVSRKATFGRSTDSE